MNKVAQLSVATKSVWSGGGAWAWGHAVLVVTLIAVLVATVVLQGAARSSNRKARRTLNVALAPLLVIFLVVVVQRFRTLSF